MPELASQNSYCYYLPSTEVRAASRSVDRQCNAATLEREIFYGAKHAKASAAVFSVTLFISMHYAKQQSMGGVEHKLVVLPNL